MSSEEIAIELYDEIVALLNPYEGMPNTEEVRTHAEVQANNFLRHQIRIGRIRHDASVYYRYEITAEDKEITVRLVENTVHPPLCPKCGENIFMRLDETTGEFRCGRTRCYLPPCPKCGDNLQVWKNQITGKLTCHRAFCHTEIEDEAHL
jgi:predicted RNA-binding Zn-ribbon protein involved in translation (DUF1610 family)